MAGAAAVCFGTLAQRSPASRETIHRALARTPPACLVVCDVNLRQQWYDREVLERSLAAANLVKLNDHEVLVLAEVLGTVSAEHVGVRPGNPTAVRRGHGVHHPGPRGACWFRPTRWLTPGRAGRGGRRGGGGRRFHGGVDRRPVAAVALGQPGVVCQSRRRDGRVAGGRDAVLASRRGAAAGGVRLGGPAERADGHFIWGERTFDPMRCRGVYATLCRYGGGFWRSFLRIWGFSAGICLRCSAKALTQLRQLLT